MTDRRLASAAIAALLVMGCGHLVPVPPNVWKVDVIPADEPLIVSISTGSAAWMWLVEPGPPSVLLVEGSAIPGGIELIDPTNCRLQDAEQLLPASFTIRLLGPLPGRTDYQMQLDPEAPLSGSPISPNTTNCSG